MEAFWGDFDRFVPWHPANGAWRHGWTFIANLRSRSYFRHGRSSHGTCSPFQSHVCSHVARLFAGLYLHASESGARCQQFLHIQHCLQYIQTLYTRKTTQTCKYWLLNKIALCLLMTYYFSYSSMEKTTNHCMLISTNHICLKNMQEPLLGNYRVVNY